MTGQKKKMSSGRGSKLPRSQTVTVRLDPKLRYLAELGARCHRRTLSSFIEWAIEQSLRNLVAAEPDEEYGAPPPPTLASEAEELWDVDAADRMAKLALRYPKLLTHGEQVLWKLIRENGYVWRRHMSRHRWDITEENLNFIRLREKWALFQSVARGEADVSSLPTWDYNGTAAKPAIGQDIPF